MKEKLKRFFQNYGNKIFYVVVIAVFVVAAVLVVVGVSTHEEPTVTDSGQWDRDAFPLRVLASRYTSEGNEPADGMHEVDHVIDTVNQRLGFDALMWADGEEAEIVIVIGLPFGETWEDPGGHFELRGSGDRFTRCDISTSNTGTAEILALTLHHEVGHCLGLKHDNYRSSIMYPQQTPTPDGVFPPRITDDDRSTLRQMYAPTSGVGPS